MTITGLLASAMHASAHPRCWSASLAALPRTGVEVRVVDEDDSELPPGEIGEIVVRGDCVMAGYWRQPGSDRGDAARRLAAHRRHRQLRRRRLPDPAGPLQGHDHLRRHATSTRARSRRCCCAIPPSPKCSVVGRPHPEWGEEVVAFVVAAAGRTSTQAELDALCLDNIARFKRPKEYRFVDELPKNNYGKVLKTELRKRL